jgi:long-subunit fatty acid transport protein
VMANEARAIVANPSFSGEITYTSANHSYAFGVGISQVFGNQSKSKDREELGSQGQFYDTKVASNDLSFGAAIRLHSRLSVGATFILGRGFVDQKAPTPQLAAAGIIRQSRLDVSDLGAPGISFGVHSRISKRINFGLNFKTKRRYDLEGTLETVQPIISGVGIQLIPLTLDVRVPLKLPSVLETGIVVKPTNKLLLDADYRLYNYRSALHAVSIIEKQSLSVLMTQSINARNVHLFIFGGVYGLNDDTKIHFGSAYITNGIPSQYFSPGLYNSGGGEISGGVGKRLLGRWVNISLMGIFGRDRHVAASQNPTFAGNYKSSGLIVGLGIRR